MITYEDAVKIQELYEEELFKHEEVRSVGVVKEKDSDGRETGGYCICIGLNKHIQRDWKPPAVIPLQSVEGAEQKFISVKTEEIGEIRPLYVDFSSANDIIPVGSNIAEIVENHNWEHSGKESTYFNPIKNVLSRLSESHSYQRSYGKVVEFRSNHSLKIFRRSFSTSGLQPWVPPRISLAQISFNSARHSPNSPLKSALVASIGVYETLRLFNLFS